MHELWGARTHRVSVCVTRSKHTPRPSLREKKDLSCSLRDTSISENKVNAHKRLCIAKYSAALGGQRKCKCEKDMVKFLNSTSRLPNKFKVHLTALANENPVMSKAFTLLASGEELKPAELQVIL